VQAPVPTEDDEPDQPHIEEQSDKPNPFAALARAPKPIFEAPKPSPAAKPAENASTNPFGSIFKPTTPSPANGTSLFSSPSKPTTEQTSTSTPAQPTFSTTPSAGSLFDPKPVQNQPSQPAQSSTPTSTSLFKGSTPTQPATTTSSNFFSQPSASSTAGVPSTAPSTNLFSQAAPKPAAPLPNLTPANSAPPAEKKTSNGDIPPQVGLTSSTEFTGLKSKWLTDDIRLSMSREDNFEAPPLELEFTEEETKYYYQRAKLARLNLSYREWFTSRGANDKAFQLINLTPIMANYIQLYEELASETIQGPLTDLITAHGAVEGQRIFDQQKGRLPIDGSSKRRAGGDISRESQSDDENAKKTKTDATGPQSAPQFAPSPAASETSNMFRSILDKEAPAQDQANGVPPVTNGTQSTASGNSLFSSTAKHAETTTSSATASTASATPGFKVPQFGALASSTTSSTIKPPVFGAPAANNFFSQFGQSAAKDAVKEAKDAKQKQKDDEFDSEEDDEEEWERNYEAKQAAKRQEIEEAKQAKVPKYVAGKGFVFEDANPSARPSSLAPPPTNGGLFGSRSVSPAPSTSGGASVFDGPRSASPNVTNGNIFGHLSGSDVDGSGKGDADDEDSDDDGERANPAKGPSGSARKFAGFSESDEPPSDTPSGQSLFARITSKHDTAESAAPSGGLFGRITPRDEKPEPTSTENTASGLLGRVTKDNNSDRAPLSTTEGNQTSLFNFTKTSPGDHTWKPDSPIRFGASTSNNSTSTTGNPFGGLTRSSSSTPAGGIFGASTSGNATTSLFNFPPSSKPASSESTSTPAFSFAPPSNSTTPFGSPAAKGNSTSMFGNAFGAKPTSLFPPSATPSVLGSGLTSAVTSRATTPGLSDMSGAESTAGEGEEEKLQEQISIDDLVGMSKDQEGHDVLFECREVKALKFGPDKSDSSKNAWETQGVGPIAILKNQDTGVVSILMKKVPNGAVAINTRLVPKAKYEQIKKRARFMIVGSDGKPGNWLVQFPGESEAAEFVKVCQENQGGN
jgi:hypothetical protein